MLRVRIIDPSDAVRLETTCEPWQAAAVALLVVSFFFLGDVLLSPGRHRARQVLREKVALSVVGAMHMALSRDKRFSLSREPDPAQIAGVEPLATKRIILVRHGESLWNGVFNKSPMLLMPVRLIVALMREALLLFELDSIFLDSPLSPLGRRQARDLSAFLSQCAEQPKHAGSDAAQRDVQAMNGVGSASSVVVSSMLRRAVTTAWLALEARLSASGGREPMLLHSGLQEMSRNVDTLSIAPAHAAPGLSMAAGEFGTVPDLSHCTSARYNAGNKAVSAVALARMKGFAAWCCARPEDTLVVVGHSFYFRQMFKLWLPRGAEHPAKKKKIVNCGVVGLTLTQARLPNGQLHYRIDPESVTVVYGGFGGK